jgi:hypothetical protein
MYIFIYKIEEILYIKEVVRKKNNDQNRYKNWP